MLLSEGGRHGAEVMRERSAKSAGNPGYKNLPQAEKVHCRRQPDGAVPYDETNMKDAGG